MTSAGEHPDLAAGYELGANAYLVKPVNVEELRKAVLSLAMSGPP